MNDAAWLRELLEPLVDGAAAHLRASTSSTETPLQAYTRELFELCERVLEEADERTAAAFWGVFINVAARHGRRAGGLE